MNRPARRLSLRALAFAAAALALPFVSPASADDRDVLRDAATRPYMFVLLDTSGSMNWSPKCTADQVAAGICTYRCDTGDCSTPRNGDDPASKFRQAKEALYEVLLGQSQGPRFGGFVELYGVEQTRSLIGKALAGELVGKG